ncbi:cupin domain-containing protein [Halotia wernerae UHCC 0503]|nr:cupin domain-containing protein [Halotia wernerae UHCC 0503]
MEDKKPLILRAEQIANSMQTFSHPWNPNSEISGTYLGRTVGLKRTGVNFAKVPPGKESFVYHSHYREEEWIYILSGRGIAEIDGEELEVSAGDFMGFPTPSVAHHLKNAGDEDLVYLVGGENLDLEIAEFPHFGKRMLRREDDIEIYNLSDAKPFGALDT